LQNQTSNPCNIKSRKSPRSGSPKQFWLGVDTFPDPIIGVGYSAFLSMLANGRPDPVAKDEHSDLLYMPARGRLGTGTKDEHPAFLSMLAKGRPEPVAIDCWYRQGLASMKTSLDCSAHFLVEYELAGEEVDLQTVPWSPPGELPYFCSNLEHISDHDSLSIIMSTKLILLGSKV
jgi:hypothetical protein